MAPSSHDPSDPASSAPPPRGGAYDVLIIGSGLGGLSAAAFLARLGRKVLVIERQDQPGGYAHAFRRGPYTFDPAIHFVPFAREGEPVDTLLRFLGVRDRCEFIPFHDYYTALFPEFRLDVPFGLEPIIQAYTERFPHEAAGIRGLFETAVGYSDEARGVPIQLSLKDLDREAERFPTYFRYRSRTWADVLDECLTDPRVKAACSSTWAYFGLPPSHCSFDVYCRLQGIQINGLYHLSGSFQALPDALVASLRQNGGELLCDATVSMIDLDDQGRASGVTLEDGRSFRGRYVISNADAHQTFGMLGWETLPEAYVRRVRRLKPSLSAFILFAATSLDLRQFGPGHEMFLHRQWDHDATYQDILAGKPGGMWAVVPTLTDPSLAPPGEHLIILSSLAAYNIGRSWEEEREPFQEALLGELEGLFPGVRGSLTFVESATPETLERYTGNWQGAIYGWANSLAQAGSKRLAYQTPVPGLFLSGHWSQPAGSLRVMVSGTHVAKIILSSDGETDLGPDI